MTEKTHASLAIPSRETESGHALPPRHREWKRAKIAVCIVLVLLALGALRTVIANVMQSRSVAETTKQNAVQYVNVVSPRRPKTAATHCCRGRCAATWSRRFTRVPRAICCTGTPISART